MSENTGKALEYVRRNIEKFEPAAAKLLIGALRQKEPRAKVNKLGDPQWDVALRALELGLHEAKARIQVLEAAEHRVVARHLICEFEAWLTRGSTKLGELRRLMAVVDVLRSKI